MKQLLLAALILVFAGCSQKSAEYGAAGAATGAIGAGMVGALTDLIVDGKVNPYRLKRNVVSGAIAGGMTGAAAGHQAEQRQQTAKAEPTSSGNNRLRKRIGEQNYHALELLVHCQHKEAYALALKSAKSDMLNYELGAYAVQALIDKDRGNSEGVQRAIEAFIAKDDKITTVSKAREELDKVYQSLQDERRIEGLNPNCS